MDIPKSMILGSEFKSFLLNKIFSGFISLCIIPYSCIYAIADNI